MDDSVRCETTDRMLRQMLVQNEMFIRSIRDLCHQHVFVILDLKEQLGRDTFFYPTVEDDDDDDSDAVGDTLIAL